MIAVAVFGTIASVLLSEFNSERKVLQEDQDRKREEEQKERDRERVARDKQIEIQRKLDENKDQLRKEILRKENEIYANTKRARRLLRARAFHTPFYDVWNSLPDSFLIGSKTID